MTLVRLGHLTHWTFLGAACLLALGWLWQALQWIRFGPTLPDLTRLPAASPQPAAGDQPQLTVIVPACNEQASIQTTLRSLLGSTGIRLQVIAVNDRSTDQTGALIDSLAADFASAASPHSLQVLHIAQLPPGWLGKPHALASAAALAQSDWLLFTDGDLVFAPQALSLALGYAQADQTDHLILMPDWILKSFGERAMHGAMHALSCWTLHLWRVADPKARDFLGVGAFNLLRRSTYEALGGFASLRMEVLEDVRLGWRLKRAGFRQRVVLGPGLAAVRWSQGAWGVVRNLEKNLFALYRFSVPVTLAACFGVALQIVLPLAALATAGPARLAGLVTLAAITAIYLASARVTRVPPAYVLVYPFAWALFLFAMLRSMTLALVRGGVTWRGTLYPLAELRKSAGSHWN